MFRKVTRVAAWVAVAVPLALAFSASAQSPSGASGTVGELERTAEFSAQEKISYAEDANAEMRAAVKEVTKLAESSKKSADQQSLQCVLDRQKQIRALAQVSEVATAQMNEALKTEKPERADHEFRKVAVALVKVRALLAEAEACADAGGVRGSDFTLKVIGGIDADGDDTQAVALDELDIGDQPPESSPFM